MTIADRDRLRAIKTFPSLVKYLRDELDWPIEQESFDDLTFDYEPEELGIDAKTAAKIEAIKQLRPLTTNQPWGIFFLKFEPKRLPVVALRRILRSLVVRKRLSANRSERAAWHLHDLLFISAYGEDAERQITFAHFAESPDTADLPTLRVLGWDDADTALHIDHVHQELHNKLRWPENLTGSADLDTWRTAWASAFTLRHREVISTSQMLAVQLADLARAIRKRVNAVLAIESGKGPFRSLMAAFKEALIHDLTEDDFADMYAQTISYGLLTARVSRPTALIAANIADMVPVTNPFLKDMLGTFLTVGGRKGHIDFDEVGINDVVELLRRTNMEAVLRDFGNRTQHEDPVIHFYELFLAEYDRQKKIQRGVFYTPQPVVSYIVRSVHELLQTEFGLEDGLASTITWGEFVQQSATRNPKSEIRIPDGVRPDEPFVQILDPATGTATFLVEVIDVIHCHLRAKWDKDGAAGMPPIQNPKSKIQNFEAYWNAYVPQHLLPRLYGYELMMAPYAIAHMKLGLKLGETGYRFGSDERARIYLTNALEPPQDFSDQFESMAPALAHEAKAVNAVKRQKRFTVVIGNPPYSKISSNLTPEMRSIVDRYRYVDGERIKERGALQFEINLQDDYVKFCRLCEETVNAAHVGVLG